MLILRAKVGWICVVRLDSSTENLRGLINICSVCTYIKKDTVYHFTLQAESDSKLEEGLDRFGSFFTCPLFTEGATGRELNAIESEHAKVSVAPTPQCL